jgi:hypothetical protein
MSLRSQVLAKSSIVSSFDIKSGAGPIEAAIVPIEILYSLIRSIPSRIQDLDQLCHYRTGNPCVVCGHHGEDCTGDKLEVAGELDLEERGDRVRLLWRGDK